MKLKLVKVKQIVQDCLVVAQNEFKIFDPEELYSRALKKLRDHFIKSYFMKF